jgi:hypothetical protein
MRSLTERNEVYRQLLRDYEKIVNYYFVSLEQVSGGPWEAVGFWETGNKENMGIYSQTTKLKLSDSTHL